MSACLVDDRLHVFSFEKSRIRKIPIGRVSSLCACKPMELVSFICLCTLFGCRHLGEYYSTKYPDCWCSLLLITHRMASSQLCACSTLDRAMATIHGLSTVLQVALIRCYFVCAELACHQLAPNETACSIRGNAMHHNSVLYVDIHAQCGGVFALLEWYTHDRRYFVVGTAQDLQ